MNKKIIVLGLVSIFLLTSISSISAVDVSTKNVNDNGDEEWNINVVGYEPASSKCEHLDIQDNYAYVLYSDPGLRSFKIIDISNPADPIVVSSYPLEWDAEDIIVNGDYAYIAYFSIDNDEFLAIFDISDPTNPTLVGKYEITFWNIQFKDNVIFGCDGWGITSIDVSDPANPVKIGYLAIPAFKIALKDNYIYSIKGGQFSVVDITDPANPTVVSFLNSEEINEAWEIYVDENYAYAGKRYENELVILDIKDPQYPHIVAKYPIFETIRAINSFDNYVALGTSYGVSVLDISDVENIRPVGRIDSGIQFDVFVRADYIYSAVWSNSGYNHGFFIYKFNGRGIPDNPSKPSGPTVLIRETTHTFSSSAVDPQGDDLYYWFDWGDNSDSGWVGPYKSGENAQASHSWRTVGIENSRDFEIKVKAKDTNGVVSDWSDPLKITVKRSKDRSFTNPKPNDQVDTYRFARVELIDGEIDGIGGSTYLGIQIPPFNSDEIKRVFSIYLGIGVQFEVLSGEVRVNPSLGGEYKLIQGDKFQIKYGYAIITKECDTWDIIGFKGSGLVKITQNEG